MKKLFRKLIRWAFKEEIDNLIADFASVSVDVHYRSKSWAVINIEKKGGGCYLKFIDLGYSQLKEIYEFLSHFEDRHIDASPLDMANFDSLNRKKWF